MWVNKEWRIASCAPIDVGGGLGLLLRFLLPPYCCEIHVCLVAVVLAWYGNCILILVVVLA